MAQVVAHLIGSEEVTGPSPVSSLVEEHWRSAYMLGFRCFLLSVDLSKKWIERAADGRKQAENLVKI